MSAGATVTQLILAVGERDHVLGPRSAPVTLVEYGDFECPRCARAHPVVKEALRRLGRSVRFVYRHFPSSVVHPRAQAAAEAAEAAGAQGRFWDMHDLLFRHQDALDEGDLLAYGAALGLNRARFVPEMAAKAYAARVREDFMGGVRAGVTGTPTFFVNGVRHDGPHDLRTLLAALRGALASAELSPR
jgi:protein-disulfide isomerase